MFTYIISFLSPPFKYLICFDKISQLDTLSHYLFYFSSKARETFRYDRQIVNYLFDFLERLDTKIAFYLKSDSC